MAMLDWLMAPLSGSLVHHVDPWVAWHARAMVLAWGLLLPLGALAARYLKIAPGQDWPRELDHPLWWHLHRALQYGGLTLAAVGVLLVWPGAAASPGGPAGAAPGSTVAALQLPFDSVGLHGTLGWCVMALGAIQLASGWLRGSKGGPTGRSMRGDHYDMSLRRRLFERMHKSLGWLSVALAVTVIGLGLYAADAPRWMPIALALWWFALGVWALRQQRAGRCVDTYQAIWGPDPRHPGNRLRPIGWGVRRSSGASHAQGDPDQ